MSNRHATICRTYQFEAAHYLPQLRDGHPCKRMHGHSYEVAVMVAGEVDAAGMVRGIEFEKIDVVMAPLIVMVDHNLFNDLLEQPTVENIAQWFADMLFKILAVPLSVRVYEGPKSWAEVDAG